MAWFARFTRFGNAHMVCGQEKNVTCGIASAMMVNFKMKSGTLLSGARSVAAAMNPFAGAQVGATLASGATDAAVIAEQEVYKLYGAELAKYGMGTSYSGGSYSYTGPLRDTLNKLNIGTWDHKDVGNNVADYIIDSVAKGWPIIVRSDWQTPTGDAHFVVVDAVNGFFGNTYASICDPWDANVHITKIAKGTAIRYSAHEVCGFNVNYPGQAKPFAYGAAQEGVIAGWVVYCKSAAQRMFSLT